MKEICHAHNATPDLAADRRFGIRVRLKPGDTFTRLIGAEWEQHHWYGTQRERDAALEDMSREHLYSRRGDRPTLIFDAVERSSDD